MGWKDCPYWKKGGIILEIVPLFIFLQQAFTGECSALVIMKSCSLLEALILPIILIIPTFIIGAMIGLVYGKIKSRNIQ